MQGAGWRGLVVLALLGPAYALAEDRPAAAPPGSCPGEVATDRILRVEDRGEVALASGGRVRLADIRIDPSAGEGAGRPGPRSWLASLAGQEVAVRRIGPPDRWGRAPASLALVEGAARHDLAAFLVSEGWALVDAGERDTLCEPALLAAEGRARAGRLGLWKMGTLPLAAGDPEPLRAQSGRFAVVEGRVVSVGERKDRTYLNFGRDFSRDFAVVVPRRLWAAMKRSGVSAAELKGRTVRVRGIVEIRRAPQIELLSDHALEWRGAAIRP
ncbi:thermonuclease family protein [uncultured Enterovirga sp.]|uniref:thermonuclease family protein n=1 Tax=uncultured Enterovirga sp. TaxID=2026352 RepID=UPI0035CA781F